MPRTTIDATKLFNQAAHSDITIQVAGREIKAHRLILCNNSEYFQRALGPDSPWLETGTGVFTLEEDDPDAVEEMLRHIYGFEYVEDESDDGKGWAKHLNLAIVADKYLLRDLKASAFKDLTNSASKLIDAKSLVALLCRAEEFLNEEEWKRYKEKICEDFFMVLHDYPDFRQLVNQDRELQARLFESWYHDMNDNSVFRAAVARDGELALKLLDEWSWHKRLVMKQAFICAHCGTGYVAGKWDELDEHECWKCRYEAQRDGHGGAGQLGFLGSCWLDSRQ